MKRCKSCGACQECGAQPSYPPYVPPYRNPWLHPATARGWSVFPPYQPTITYATSSTVGTSLNFMADDGPDETGALAPLQ